MRFLLFLKNSKEDFYNFSLMNDLGIKMGSKFLIKFYGG